MINEFVSWFEENRPRLWNNHIQITLTRGDVGIQRLGKANAGLESGNLLASITVWETGELETIILDKSTEEEIIVDDRKLLTVEDMRSTLEHYGNLIINGRRG